LLLFVLQEFTDLDDESVWKQLARLKINEKSFTSDVRSGHLKLDETIVAALTNKNIQSLMLAFYSFDVRDFVTRNSVKTRLSAYSAASSSTQDYSKSAGNTVGKHKHVAAPSPSSESTQSPAKKTRLSQEVDVSVVREMIKKAVSPLETELKGQKLSKLTTNVASVEKQLSDVKESLKSLRTSVQDKAGDRNTVNKKAFKEVEDDLDDMKKKLLEIADSSTKALEAQNQQHQALQRQLAVNVESLNCLQQNCSELGQQFKQYQLEIIQQMENQSQQIKLLQSMRSMAARDIGERAGVMTAHFQNDQPNQNSVLQPTNATKYTQPYAQMTHYNSTQHLTQPSAQLPQPMSITYTQSHTQPTYTTQSHTQPTYTTQPHTQPTQNTLDHLNAQTSVHFTPSHSIQNISTQAHIPARQLESPHYNVMQPLPQVTPYAPTQPLNQQTQSETFTRPTAQFTLKEHHNESTSYTPKAPTLPTHYIPNQPCIQTTQYTPNQHINQHHLPAHFSSEVLYPPSSVHYTTTQQHTHSTQSSNSVTDPTFSARLSQPQGGEVFANQQGHGQQQQGAAFSLGEVVQFLNFLKHTPK